MSFLIQERKAGPVTILELSGRLTMGEGSEMLKGKLQSLIADRHGALLLDCRQMSAIDSTGIQALLWVVTSAEGKGAKLKLLKPSARVWEALNLMRLLTVIQSFDDEEGALRSFAT